MQKKNEMPSPVVHHVSPHAAFFGVRSIVQRNLSDGSAQITYSGAAVEDIKRNRKRNKLVICIWRVKKTSKPLILRMLERKFQG